MRKTILIADDDPAVAGTLREMLANHDYVVECVSDGAQALDRVQRFAYDAVCLDVQMPNLNGVAAAQILRRRRMEQRIVLMTGAATESTKEAAGKIEGVTLLTKPFSESALVDAVNAPVPSRGPRNAMMIVEDFAPLRGLLEEVFTKEGWNAVSVGDGDEAIRCARSRRSRVALVDLHVPGPNGAELVRRLREADPTLYIFMMTGEATSREVAAAYAAGAQGLIAKPFVGSAAVKALADRREEIETYRRRAAEEERIESLPGWKRAAHEARTFADEARAGKHRQQILTGAILAASVVFAFVASAVFQKVSDAMAEAPKTPATPTFHVTLDQREPLIFYEPGEMH